MGDNLDDDYKKLTELEKLKFEIKGIKTEIIELRSDFKKLSKRTDKIELLGIQDQFNSLHDLLIETRRWLAYVQIHEYCLFLDVWIANKLSESTSPTFEQTAEFIRTKGIKAHSKVEKSSNPMPVAVQFMSDCAEYFVVHGLEPFRDYKIF
jgi:hypothetical protein